MFENKYEEVIIPSRDPSRRNNGGEYDFGYHFYLRPDGQVEVEYSTSAEFDFCRVWGQFQSCYNCPDYKPEEGCLTSPQVISREEAEKMILRLCNRI